MKITLAKALKEKSRLAKEIGKIKRLIQDNNSYLSENKPAYDVAELQDKLQDKTKNLVELKIKIQTANIPILEYIYWISEYKSQADFLHDLNTVEGKHESSRHFGSSDLFEYKAQLSAIEVNKIVDELDKYIDLFQDKIDEYNHKKKIEI